MDYMDYMDRGCSYSVLEVCYNKMKIHTLHSKVEKRQKTNITSDERETQRLSNVSERGVIIC